MIKNNNELISVIISTYNRSHLLGRSIRSVLSQTYSNIQIIVVDDNSKDDTEKTVKDFEDKRISYIKHEINKGGSAARNTGIHCAEGDYIAFLDDDDEWIYNKLELQMEKLNEEKTSMMSYTGRYYIDDKSKDIIKTVVANKSGRLYDELLVSNCVGTTSSALIKKECFQNVGVFDETLPGCQDWDMWIRIAREYPISCVSEPLVRYYVHDIRMTSNVDAKIKAKKMLFEKIYPDIRDRRNILSQHHFVLGELYCRINKMSKGRSELVEAIRLNPLNLDCYKYYIPALFGERFYQMAARASRLSRSKKPQ